MAYTYFGQFLDIAEQIGFFDYLLPFLLYFSLIFGLLERVDLFGRASNTDTTHENNKDKEGNLNKRPLKSNAKDSRKINLLIALSMAFLIMYYYPPSRTLGSLLAELLTQWGAFVLFLFLIPVAMAALGVPVWDLLYPYDKDKQGHHLSGIGWAVFIVVFLVLIVLFYDTIGQAFDTFWVFVDPKYLGVFLVLAFIITLVILVGSTEDQSS
ncbi:MAG: hypothetical protein GXN99_02130 [Candidatus Nanohaloarchaeota archaeon]|nr:hypothetical protein [Candidatus Nanohaloarchaeota archaeon]